MESFNYSLHKNFYKNSFEYEKIKAHATNVEQFIVMVSTLKLQDNDQAQAKFLEYAVKKNLNVRESDNSSYTDVY
jgi:hypothetical protein